VTSNFRDSQNFRTLVVTRPTRRFYFVQASHPTLRGDYVPAAGRRAGGFIGSGPCVSVLSIAIARHAPADMLARADDADGDTIRGTATREREVRDGRAGAVRRRAERKREAREGVHVPVPARERRRTEVG
jgi:hypothetical protein